MVDAKSSNPSVQGVRRFNELLAKSPQVSATAIQTVGSKGYDGFAIAIVEGFQNNDALIGWVNNQPLASIVTCLGDGHDGIWNIIHQLAPNAQYSTVRFPFFIG